MTQNDNWGSLSPVDEGAEEATIGAVLVNPPVYYELAGTLSANDFFLLRHRYIWQAIERLAQHKTAIDYQTVISELRALNRLDEIGGAVYLTQLIGAAPSSMHGAYYGEIVRRLATRRRLLWAGDQTKSLANDTEKTLEEVRAEVDKVMLEAWGKPLGTPDKTVRELLHEQLDWLEKRQQEKDAGRDLLIGAPMGYRDLDKMLLGAERGSLYIVAGRPGMGKSAFLLGMLLNMARAGTKSGIASFEMPDKQLMQRLLALESGVNLMDIRSGRMGKDDQKRFFDATGRMAKLEPWLQICDKRMTPKELRSKCLQWMHETGLRVLFVDYLQIMKSAAPPNTNRTQVVGEFARELKAMAKDLNIAVIAAAQINREVEGRENKRPAMSDLRESGEIEQEADVIMFLYRDEVYNPDTAFPGNTEVIISKNRNGEVGTINMYFDNTTTRFINAKVQEREAVS